MTNNQMPPLITLAFRRLPDSEKAWTVVQAFSRFVAGAGFEPATSGL